jgi:hypothetical protein
MNRGHIDLNTQVGVYIYESLMGDSPDAVVPDAGSCSGSSFA